MKPHKKIADIHDQLETLNINIKGRVAANENQFGNSLYLCFHGNWQYFGGAKHLDEEELIEKKIDYLFMWDSSGEKTKWVEKHKEITQDKIEGLKVYQLNHKE